jgi:hypothetical protein
VADIEITVLRASPETRALLSEILIEVVGHSWYSTPQSKAARLVCTRGSDSR